MIDETARDIRDMRTHSSSVIAIKAAEALRALVDREFDHTDEMLQSLERNSRVLRQANPSHAWLQSTQRRLIESVLDHDPTSVSVAKTVLSDAIDETVSEISEATDRAAARAADEFTDESVFLTHDYSTTVSAFFEQRVTGGTEANVFVTEARPRLMGRRMARTLGDMDPIDVTLIVDSAAGHYLDSCDRVLLGMDCVVGDVVYNRVGTYQLAAVAAHRGVPVTVIGADAKIVEGEFVFENDDRAAIEVMREPAPTFRIGNPPYDATPLDLIDTIVTDARVINPDTA